MSDLKIDLRGRRGQQSHAVVTEAMGNTDA